MKDATYRRAASVLTIQSTARHLLPLGICIGCSWLVLQHLDDLDFSRVWSTVRSVHVWQWTTGLFATAVSFWAVGRYDVVAHRHFQTGLDARGVTKSGAASVALGQTLGAGVLVGAFVRWRLQPDLGLLKATKIAGFVAITFLVSLVLIISAATSFSPISYLPVWVGNVTVVAGLILVIAGFLFPTISLFGFRITLPTLRAMAAFLCLCLIDTIFAAGALFIFLPNGLSLGFAAFLPAFLIALGVAIFSGTPGGVGPFELALLVLIPQASESDLFAAIISFRLIYYALPAILAAGLLFRHLRSPAKAPQTGRRNSDVEAALSKNFARAELGVLRQNGGALLENADGACGIVQTGQTLTALFDPFLGNAGLLTKPLREAR